jgi:hypothetical protein
MSQSATLYRISKETFEQLRSSEDSRNFDIASAKNYTSFHGSFMGLEYLLSKGQGERTRELISEIFNPKEALGGQEFENMPPEEQFEFYGTGEVIPYLDTNMVSEISKLLGHVTEADFQANYNAKELNDNGIYPQAWHNDNPPDQAFNVRQLTDDLAELKTIFQQASTDKDYFLVFVE